MTCGCRSCAGVVNVLLEARSAQVIKLSALKVSKLAAVLCCAVIRSAGV